MDTIAKDSAHWTVLSLINWGSEYLASKGIESARLNIELLLSHLLGCTRIQLYTNYDQPLNPGDLASLKKLVQRRLTREPLQYILGATNFMGLELRVDHRVLVPRPETEILVEEVVLDAAQYPRHTMLDIGTGSGNIPLAIAKQVAGCMIDSVDISEDALSLAALNVRSHRMGERISLVQGDVFSPGWRPPRPHYDVIVSNPPYISAKEFDLVDPEIRHFEPVIATTDSSDGLTFYKRIAEIGAAHLADRGKIFVEIAYNQCEEVKEIFLLAGYLRVTHRRDYSGIPRCLMISRS